ASGIQKKNSLPTLDARLMGVSANQHLKLCSGGRHIELLRVVKQGDGNVFGAHARSFRNLFRPFVVVVISTNRNNRSKLSKFFDDFGAPDIARVENQIYVFENYRDLRAQKAMG